MVYDNVEGEQRAGGRRKLSLVCISYHVYRQARAHSFGIVGITYACGAFAILALALREPGLSMFN